MTSYYVTLISGASNSLYVNTPSRFTNKMPIPLTLSEDIEFGICELSYVRNFDNIEYLEGGMSVYDFFYKKEDKSGELTDILFGALYSFDIVNGYYENANELCHSLNRLIWSKISRLNYRAIINYDKPTRKFFINTAGTYITLFFKSPLIQILGLHDKEYKKGERYAIGMSKPALGYKYKTGYRKFIDTVHHWKASRGGLLKFQGKLKTTDTLHIYCDLVLQQYSGDTFSNLLRMCPVRGVDNQRVVEKFQKIHYLPVSKYHVNAINIHIKTIEDLFINLKEITYVKLHFRTKKKKE